MNLQGLKTRWETHEMKLNEHLKVNTKKLKEVQMKKAKMSMRKLLFFRIGEAVVFFVFVVSLWGYILNHSGFSAPVISAAILNLFSHIGLIGSIAQINLLLKIDYLEPILKVQKQIAKVQSHGVQLLRLMLLSVPFYLTYIFLGWELLFGFNLFSYMDSIWFVANVTFSVLLIAPTLWLIREIDKNVPNYKWVRHLRQNAAGLQAIAAAKFLNEIKSFKRDS